MGGRTFFFFFFPNGNPRIRGPCLLTIPDQEVGPIRSLLMIYGETGWRSGGNRPSTSSGCGFHSRFPDTHTQKQKQNKTKKTRLSLLTVLYFKVDADLKKSTSTALSSWKLSPLEFRINVESLDDEAAKRKKINKRTRKTEDKNPFFA